MKKTDTFTIIIHLTLFLFTISIIVPFMNIIAVSFTDPARLSEVTGLTIFPKGFSFQSYEIILKNPQMIKSVLNSIFITVSGTLLNLLLTVLGAYVLTRENLFGKKFFMLLLIIVMVFEPSLITEYLVVKKIGLLNTYLGVILYKAVNIYYLIILMRFFEEIPKSLTEAAVIDGAGEIDILFRILLPLAKPALVTMTMFYSVFHWNEYFRASIYLNDSSKWPLQVILRQFVVLDDTTSMISSNALLTMDKVANINLESLKAGTIILAVLPILLIYPLILKYYVKGTLDGGVKE